MINWCKLFIHKWKYNQEGTERICQRSGCPVHQFWDDDVIGSGHATDGIWKDIKKRKTILHDVKD